MKKLLITSLLVPYLQGCSGFYLEASGSLLYSDSISVDKDVEKKRVSSHEDEESKAEAE